MRLKTFAGAACISLFAATSGYAATFSFTFSSSTSNVDGPDANVAGPITGRIFGLLDDGLGQAASSIVFDSIPTGLLGADAHPADVTNWTNQIFNSFDVVAGQITNAEFAALNDGIGLLCLNAVARCFGLGADLSLPNPGVNYISFDGAATSTSNDEGFGGVTFANVAAVPLPAGGLLLLSGLGGVAALKRRKKRAALS